MEVVTPATPLECASPRCCAGAKDAEEVRGLLPPHMQLGGSAAPTNETYVVVLYYCYVALAAEEVEQLRATLEAQCVLLGLCGRVRVSVEGLNGTLGGRFCDVAEHVMYLRAGCALLRDVGPTIHFKFGAADASRSVESQRLRGLSVRVTRAVVTLAPNTRKSKRGEGVGAAAAAAAAEEEAAAVRLPPECGAARHVSPHEWHKLLSAAAGEPGEPPLVLLDTRNVYETAVGHFDVSGVERVEPGTRQFSDFPAFVAANAEGLFRGKRVAMYCTGGVRCERASELLTAPAIGCAEVVQLENGIHAYLDAFPDGGHFAGKNFVYDERMVVGPPGLAAPLRPRGACLACSSPEHDDYATGSRCGACRIRVLMCSTCAAAATVGALRCAGCRAATTPSK